MGDNKSSQENQPKLRLMANTRYHGKINGNISLSNGISWGLAAPDPCMGSQRPWGMGGPKKSFYENMIFDDFQIDL